VDRNRGRGPTGPSPRLASFPDLFSDLSVTEDEGTAGRLIEQILRLDEAITRLEEVSSQSDAEARWWAVRVLAESRSPQARRIVRLALSDPDPAVRQCAALVLRDHPDP
jgi:hypothetical protein